MADRGHERNRQQPWDAAAAGPALRDRRRSDRDAGCDRAQRSSGAWAGVIGTAADGGPCCQATRAQATPFKLPRSSSVRNKMESTNIRERLDRISHSWQIASPRFAAWHPLPRPSAGHTLAGAGHPVPGRWHPFHGRRQRGPGTLGVLPACHRFHRLLAMPAFARKRWLMASFRSSHAPRLASAS